MAEETSPAIPDKTDFTVDDLKLMAECLRMCLLQLQETRVNMREMPAVQALYGNAEALRTKVNARLAEVAGG